MEAVAASGAGLVPIDSEHNAVFQCMPQPTPVGSCPRGVRRILLTASGGPFRRSSAAELERVTPEQAVALAQRIDQAYGDIAKYVPRVQEQVPAIPAQEPPQVDAQSSKPQDD